MEKIVTPRRMTTAQNMLFTGDPGEIVIDTDKNTLVIHDGAHAGGFPLARENLSTTLLPMVEQSGIALADLANVAPDSIAARGMARNDLANVSADSLAMRGAMLADCSNGTGMASCDAPGLVRFATLDETLSGTLPDGADAKALSLASASALLDERKGLPHGYITGYAMEFVSGTQIRFGEGAAKGRDDTIDLVSKYPIVKCVDAQWEQGSGFGAMPPGTARAASTQYYAFAIRNGANGTVDILFDTDVGGANIVASGPVREWCGGEVRLRSVGQFSTTAEGDIDAQSLTNHSMDLSSAAHVAFPSSRYLALPLLLGGQKFTAPANGYYAVFFHKHTSSVTYYYLHCSSGIHSSWAVGAGGYTCHSIPMSKGQVVEAETNAANTSGMSYINIRFIYANGEI